MPDRKVSEEHEGIKSPLTPNQMLISAKGEKGGLVKQRAKNGGMASKSPNLLMMK